ncbi:Uncharacterized protein dnm_052320 [Desulfonema magnum]|uniref:Uncharacterized protein n=1 Tax=Desulfonema magnum TaxID=45655 RepID=A0A975BP92_9BACT|nr:Uncharacterized protein dnm_052320 [Desulfonema magnum]
MEAVSYDFEAPDLLPKIFFKWYSNLKKVSTSDTVWHIFA